MTTVAEAKGTVIGDEIEGGTGEHLKEHLKGEV